VVYAVRLRSNNKLQYNKYHQNLVVVAVASIFVALLHNKIIVHKNNLSQSVVAAVNQKKKIQKIEMKKIGVALNVSTKMFLSILLFLEIQHRVIYLEPKPKLKLEVE
jgi:Na+/H+ antiporter NhaD/arsenite permease-like protein